MVIFGATTRTTRMEVIGYLACMAVGLSLGLIGGGGSILTVPIMVYLFNLNPELATFYSLFVVGITSAVGSASYFRAGQVNLRTALQFGLPSIVAVFVTRWYVLPAIPEVLMSTNSFTVTKAQGMLLLFAMLMLLAAYNMIRKKSPTKNSESIADMPSPQLYVVMQGAFVGTLTGLVGAGGGFLIIPALLFLCRLNMKEAIGTSLIIIAANTLFGFFTSKNLHEVDWMFLLSTSAFALLGIAVGTALSRRIDGAKLKPAFGWFVLAMGTYIILRETVFAS
jgi:uncharacterized membrane protein YfcA